MKKILLMATLLVSGTTFLHAQAQKKAPLIAGGDRDAHGCIHSAGYVWSELKKDCIRTFEQELKLKEVNPGKTVNEVAVIFSNDNKKAEVFLPGKTGSTVLNYKPKTKTWAKNNIELTRENTYTIKVGGKPKFIYRK